MKKLLIPALCVLFGTASAETLYQFSYTGLRDWGSSFPDEFVPDYQYRGFFTVEDSNGDGTYQRDEVLEFSIGLGSNGYLFDVLNASQNGSWGYLTDFNYTPGGQLTFRGEHAYQSDEVLFSHWYYETTWPHHQYVTGPETTIRVVQVVPEPSSLMMFGGGISAVLLAARRRRSKMST